MSLLSVVIDLQQILSHSQYLGALARNWCHISSLQHQAVPLFPWTAVFSVCVNLYGTHAA